MARTKQEEGHERKVPIRAPLPTSICSARYSRTSGHGYLGRKHKDAGRLRIEKPRFIRPNRQATALPGKQATDARPKSRAHGKTRHPGQKGTPRWVVPFSDCRREFTSSCLRWFLGNLRAATLAAFEPRVLQPSDERSPFRCTAFLASPSTTVASSTVSRSSWLRACHERRVLGWLRQQLRERCPACKRR